MAIARTASGAITNWASANPASGSIDCGGGDILVVGGFLTGTTEVTMDYDGSPMVEELYFNDYQSNEQAFFYKVNPASGTKSVSISRDGSGNVSAAAAAYSGVDTSDPIDDSGSEDGSASIGTYVGNTITVGSSDNWVVSTMRDTDNRIQSCDNLTFRATSTVVIEKLWDSDGTVASGSFTPTYTLSPNGRIGGHSLVALNADTGGGGYTGDIKSIAGVLQASIKSIAGVTEANLKSIAGVSNS